MKVFKFGGASVNSAEAVKNVASIIRRYYPQELLVVISAMGKTTNSLEKLVPGVLDDEIERATIFEKLRLYHWGIMEELFPKEHEVWGKVGAYFSLLREQISKVPTTYNFDYDQTVSFGELISTTIVNEYLNLLGFESQWVDVRSVIKTDLNYREGHVDWTHTRICAKEKIEPLFYLTKLVITQGFIAGTIANTTTTLGREGSDYSASILSYCLNASSMTIWKDVPGFLNADPKYFSNTIKIEHLPYNEAIELAYYGASVIHPKTVKPIQNKNIKLYIKSFMDPDAGGSVIGPFDCIEPQTPLYIVKQNQVLISITPKDFSFIAEDNMQHIFGIFATLGMRANLVQNSALSFSICVDNNEVLLSKLIELLQNDFRVLYNQNVQLITIRYYSDQIINSIVGNKEVLLEQRSRTTEQIIVR